MITAHSICHSHDTPFDTVTLDYDARFRRRMAMMADGGLEFLLDLKEATEIKAGDSIVLNDGRLIRVLAAPEALMKAVPALDQMARMAWHVGNRHLPCEIHVDHLILRYDHVIEGMLVHLGCRVTQITGPFHPEGGAYGQGRTHGHAH